MNADPEQLDLEILPELAVSSDVVVVLVGSMEEAARVVDAYSAGENHGTIRYYEPVLGRFVSRDPISYRGGGMSLYCGYFVPNHMDWSGLGGGGGEAVPPEPVRTEPDTNPPVRTPIDNEVQKQAEELAARLEAEKSEEERKKDEDEAARAAKDALEQLDRKGVNTAGVPTTSGCPGQSGNGSPELEWEDLAGKTPDEIRKLAEKLGLVPYGETQNPVRQDGTSRPDYPSKWKDPVTGEERLRLDNGHVDGNGNPYRIPEAAAPHVHGTTANGTPIRDPLTGNNHIPTSRF